MTETTTHVTREGARAQHRRLTSLAAFVASVRLGRQLDTPTPQEKNFMPGSDVRGIRNWSVVCRVGPTSKLSEHADAARLAADVEGSKYSAAIVPRRGANLGQAYVVLSYTDWLNIVAETIGDPEDVRFESPPPEASTALQTAQTADPLSAPGPGVSSR